jgi:hypothetical protein
MGKGGYGRNRGLTTQNRACPEMTGSDEALGLARRAKQGEQG